MNQSSLKLRRTGKLLLLVLAVAPVALHGMRRPQRKVRAAMKYSMAKIWFNHLCKDKVASLSFDEYWKKAAILPSNARVPYCASATPARRK